MDEKKFILGILLGSVFLILGGLLLVVSAAKGVNVEVAQGAQVELEKKSVDWGEIKMNDGLAIANFEIKNVGSETLKLFSGTTSCACTKAKIVSDKRTSGYFGMHSKSKNIFDLAPGDTAQIVAEFDPAFHGPSGVGPIDRQVTISTNDPLTPEIKVSMFGTVVR